jgi:two-component system LytT family sensor kinase
MKRIWFPPLFGLAVYFSIRLVEDVQSGMRFWNRPWLTNAIEIGTSIAVSYVQIWVMDSIRHRNERRGTRRFLREFWEVYGYTTLILNAALVPMCALTDDGLQWHDLVDINILPPLFNLVYYAVTRTIGSLRVQSEQQRAELKFLKAQFHPHFLFNALNTVYFQIDESAEVAKRTIEKLSELLRYQLYDPQQQVPVSRELEYLQAFIDLQRQRMNPHLLLDVCFDKSLNGQHIYPLLLLPLVENAFKYAGGDYWIKISAGQEQNRLQFSVANAIPEGERSGGGIGLENLRRRLELLYPGDHSLATKKNENYYSAVLSIPI